MTQSIVTVPVMDPPKVDPKPRPVTTGDRKRKVNKIVDGLDKNVLFLSQ